MMCAYTYAILSLQSKTTAVVKDGNPLPPAQVDVAPTQRLKPHRLEVVYPVLPHLARYGYYKTSSVCVQASDFRTLIAGLKQRVGEMPARCFAYRSEERR